MKFTLLNRTKVSLPCPLVPWLAKVIAPALPYSMEQVSNRSPSDLIRRRFDSMPMHVFEPQCFAIYRSIEHVGSCSATLLPGITATARLHRCRLGRNLVRKGGVPRSRLHSPRVPDPAATDSPVPSLSPLIPASPTPAFTRNQGEVLLLLRGLCLDNSVQAKKASIVVRPPSCSHSYLGVLSPSQHRSQASPEYWIPFRVIACGV